MVGGRLDINGEEGTDPALAGDGGLHEAAVVAPVDVLQGGEVDVSIMADHDPPVLLHLVGPVVPHPVESHIGIVMRSVALYCLAPVLIPNLVLPPENKLADESETERHRFGPDSAEHVLSRAEVDPLVHGLVGAVNDELPAGDGQPLVIERIHLDLLQGVVDVLLLEPLVDGGGPALGDAEETDIVDGVPPTEVEHGVIGLQMRGVL